MRTILLALALLASMSVEGMAFMDVGNCDHPIAQLFHLPTVLTLAMLLLAIVGIAANWSVDLVDGSGRGMAGP